MRASAPLTIIRTARRRVVVFHTGAASFLGVTIDGASAQRSARMCGVAGVASPRDPRSFFASCGAPCRTYSVVSLSSLCCRRLFNFVPVPAHSVARPWVHQSCEVVLCRVVGFGSGVSPSAVGPSVTAVHYDFSRQRTQCKNTQGESGNPS